MTIPDQTSSHPTSPDQTSRARGGDAGARIAAMVRQEILAGTLEPGSRIRQEDIAARFGVSRVPVREGLRLLEYEGLVTVVANSGAWVARLTLAECEEIYQMRERLEPLLLRYSAPGLTEDDFTRLQGLATDLRAASSTEAFLFGDREFHLATYAHAHTLQLGDLIEKFWNSTAPYRRAYVATWSAESRRIASDEHDLLIATLRDGDTEEAERILAGHIRRTRRQLARRPELFDHVR